MTSSTTDIIGSDFPKQVVTLLLDAIDKGTKQAYSLIWTAIKEFLATHWLGVIIFLVIVLTLAILNYTFTGKWGWLGSVLYNYLYFGVLLIVALIFGSDIFANEYFGIFLAVLYMVCFTLVGIILGRAGIKK